MEPVDRQRGDGVPDHSYDRVEKNEEKEGKTKKVGDETDKIRTNVNAKCLIDPQNSASSDSVPKNDVNEIQAPNGYHRTDQNNNELGTRRRGNEAKKNNDHFTNDNQATANTSDDLSSCFSGGGGEGGREGAKGHHDFSGKSVSFDDASIVTTSQRRGRGRRHKLPSIHPEDSASNLGVRSAPRGGGGAPAGSAAALAAAESSRRIHEMAMKVKQRMDEDRKKKERTTSAATGDHQTVQERNNEESHEDNEGREGGGGRSAGEEKKGRKAEKAPIVLKGDLLQRLQSR